MDYAIVEVGGKQYKVSPGSSLKVDATLGEVNKEIELDKVLLLVDEGKVSVGQPLLKGKVVGTVVSQGKAKKVTIRTYKAKTGQHRAAGHRQDQTTIKIEAFKKED